MKSHYRPATTKDLKDAEARASKVWPRFDEFGMINALWLNEYNRKLREIIYVKTEKEPAEKMRVLRARSN